MNLLLIHFLIVKGKINLIMDARGRNKNAPHFQYKRNVKGEDETFDVYYYFKTNPEDVTNLRRVSLFSLLL